MTYIIAEPCLGTCDTSCVEVCPVDCILGPMSVEDMQAVGDDDRATKLATIQMFIDPEECISCGACEPECPVEAIFEEDELPSKWANYLEKNAEFFENQ